MSFLFAAAAALVLFVGATPAGAEPATSVGLNQASKGAWVGDGTAVRELGRATGENNGLTNIGDVNGDGLDDVAALTFGSTAGVSVLFAPKALGGQKSVTKLLPSQGYQIVAAARPSSIANVGDQNGDGIDDIAFQDGLDATIVYLTDDPSGYPVCPGDPTTRCLDTSTLTTADGYKLSSAPPTGTFGASIANGGDFNGDGIDDIAVAEFGASGFTGAAYIVYGGRTPSVAPTPVGSLPASEAVQIVGSQGGGFFGFKTNRAGDINGDGFDDFYFAEPAFGGADPPLGYVVYGGDNVASPLNAASFSAADGFTIALTPIAPLAAAPAGDVNGDGFSDLSVGGPGATDPNGSVTIIYGSETPPASPFPFTSPASDQGYRIIGGDAGAQLGNQLSPAGDLNADGIPDQIYSESNTEIDGNAFAGAATLVFGQRPSPSDPIETGPELTPDHGVSIVGNQENQLTGYGLASAGDLDGDGIPDYFVGAPGTEIAGGNDAGGYVGIVVGSSLVPTVKTGKAVGISDTEASVTAGISRTRGEGSYFFEYGTDTNYGMSTPTESVQGTSSVSADLTGLSPTTTYHYRVVATNGIGVKRYGEDRTFTTTATPPPTPPQCEIDPTAPGCPGFCDANPTAPGCQNQGKPGRVANIKVKLKNRRLKAGKKSKIGITVRAKRGDDRENLTTVIRVKVNKKNLIRVRKNVGFRNIKPGKSKTVRIPVRVKRKAKGKKIRFVAKRGKQQGKLLVKIK